MKKIIIVSLFFLITLKFNLSAQEQIKFSNDTTMFLSELQAYMTQVSKIQEKETRQVFKDFEYAWMSEMIPKNIKNLVYQYCLSFDEYKLYPYPYFVKYLNIIQMFAHQNQPENDQIFFHKGVNFYLNGENRNINLLNYLTQIETFVQYKSLQRTNTEEWKIKNYTYRFGFDSIPCIIFSEVDLSCVVRNDSSNIYNTSGVYYPLTLQWKGTGGKLNWQRFYYHPDTVYANLSKYEINLKLTEFTAENAEYCHKGYFKESKLIGKITDKAVVDADKIISTYPRFYMYDNQKVFMKIFPNVEYSGGFSIEGNRVIGNAINNDLAQVVFFRNNEEFINIQSNHFLIYPGRFVTDRGRLNITINEDSIYHPEVITRYDYLQNLLVLQRNNIGLGLAPFFDTYHKLDIFSDAIYWHLNQDSISFESIRGIRSESIVGFFSTDFFTQKEYEALQGIDDVNPAELVSLYSRKNRTQYFTLEDFTAWAKKPKEQINRQLIILANKGLVDYDLQSKTVQIKPRLIEFLAAQKGAKDSDVMSFTSVLGDKTNAFLNLKNFNLNVEGVSNIMLSDLQYVYVVPRNKSITVQKNRNFSFAGRVHAGLFDIETEQAFFNYDKFMINMPEISKISMIALEWEPDVFGNKGFVPVKNHLVDLNADLYIDNPDSKSGRKMFQNYPLLVSKDTSYVFFERNDIVGGAYKKDDFYFQVYPFEMDSVNTIPTPDVLFKGRLISADIFPPIEENLRIQKDYSLGFLHVIEEPGLPVYNGIGTYHDTLMLSNKGLEGKGRLDYLTSNNKSNSFLFTPNEAVANVENYNLAKYVADVEFPDAVSKSARLRWDTENNVMEVSSNQEGGFSMFDNNAKLDGILNVSPQGLFGKGKFSFEHAEVVSNKYTFKANSFVSDTANFTLLSPGDKSEALRVHIFKTNIDFDSRIGHFIATGKGALMEFPKINYNCVVDEFDWLMDENKLLLINKPHMSEQEYYNLTKQQLIKFDPGNEIYFSTLHKRGKLQFYALNALYDLNLNNLQVSGVRIVKVADAAIFPHQAKMNIDSTGKIETLVNAEILADTLNQKYYFYNASVDIGSRKSYKAQAFYDYKPVNGDSYTLKLDSIKPVKNVSTAYAYVEETDNFSLNFKFNYLGNITMQVDSDSLLFDGAFSIVNSCYDNKDISWVKINQKLHPRNIKIVLPSDPKNTSNQRLRTSIYYSLTEHKPMFGFLEPTENVSDPDIFSATGFLNYNFNTSEYQIADTSVLNNSEVPGNIARLNTIRCFLSGDGEINLTGEMGQFYLKNIGNIKFFLANDSTIVNTSMVLDFHFPDEALKNLSDDINNNVLQHIDASKSNYIRTMKTLMGNRAASKYLEEISIYGKAQKFPAELNHSIVLYDVNLEYIPDSRAFICWGPIGVNNIGNNMIMKYVPGYVEIQKRRSGDVITIYFMLEDNRWYYFNYANNTLQAISDNSDFNDKLVNLKAKERRVTKKGEPTYQFLIGTADKKATFLRKMRQMQRSLKDE